MLVCHYVNVSRLLDKYIRINQPYLLLSYIDRVTVDEASQLVRLLIKRNKGTFGSVSVFCFSQSTASGAVQLEDYKFEPRVSELKLILRYFVIMFKLASGFTSNYCHIKCINYGKT